MAVDTSIYNALGRGVKTVRDWQQEDEQRQQVAQANELNALNLTNARATAGDNALVRQDQSVIRNALQNVRPGATQEDIAGAYEGTRTPTGLTQAQAIRKAIAEAERLKAQTAASTAAAGASEASQKATEFKLQIDKHNIALNDILSFQTPAEAMESLRRHAAGGQIPPEAVQAMSRELMGMSTPEQFAQWQESKAAGLMDAKSRAELALRRQEAQDRRTNQAGEAANRDLVLDPATGRYVLNQPLQSAKVARSQAGAAVTYGSPVPIMLPDGTQGLAQTNNRGTGASVVRVDGAPAVAPPPKPAPLPVEFNKSVSGLKELANGLDSYEKALKENNGASPVALGERRANLQGAYTSLQMGLKNAFELGALAGPDLTLLQGMLADPTGIKAGALGDKGVSAQISQARQYLRNRGKAVYESHKQPVPAEYSGAGGSASAATARSSQKPAGGTDIGGGFSLKN